MYSETDRTWVRRYVGYGSVWVQSEPRLENALTATQSAADGGSRPDSSVENNIKGLIYGIAAVASSQPGIIPGGLTQNLTFNTPPLRGLIQIEASIALQDTFLGTQKADGGEIQIDPARETARLRKEGRRLCHQLARMLGMRGVRADVFAASPVIQDEDPFAYENLEHWRTGP
jgi:hypothetical protein